MDTSSIAIKVRAIALLSEHIESVPPDVGIIDALVAARTLIEHVQIRSYAERRESVAITLDVACGAIDDALGQL